MATVPDEEEGETTEEERGEDEQEGSHTINSQTLLIQLKPANVEKQKKVCHAYFSKALLNQLACQFFLCLFSPVLEKKISIILD